MDFRIALAMNRQGINLHVNPNKGGFAPECGKSVKVQIAKAKHYLRKAFAQKPDEYVPAEVAEEKVVPNRLKQQLAKLPKHKRTMRVAIPAKHKTPKTPKTQKTLFEQDMQEMSIPFISEEEQKWIDLALRNHNSFFDYKPLDEHYKHEIALGNWNQDLMDGNAKEGYKKAVEAKTKAYFDDIKADEEYKKNLYWKDLIAQNNKGAIIIEQNNKLRIVMH